jgi:hypothetical protein
MVRSSKEDFDGSNYKWGLFGSFDEDDGSIVQGGTVKVLRCLGSVKSRGNVVVRRPLLSVQKEELQKVVHRRAGRPVARLRFLSGCEIDLLDPSICRSLSRLGDLYGRFRPLFGETYMARYTSIDT